MEENLVRWDISSTAIKWDAKGYLECRKLDVRFIDGHAWF